MSTANNIFHQPLTGTFAATGQSASFIPQKSSGNLHGAVNISMWGTFVASVQVERSFDGGVNWLPLTALGNSMALTGPASEIFEEPEDGVFYRLNCTAYTSGTVNYRISQ